MLDSKYNRFIWYWLTDNLDNLLDYDDTLVCEVPFGNYTKGNQVDNNFTTALSKYLSDYNMKIVEENLINFEYDGEFSFVFSYDGSYYKVSIWFNTEEGYLYDIPWEDDNLERYQVYPKRVTITIYE